MHSKEVIEEYILESNSYHLGADTPGALSQYLYFLFFLEYILKYKIKKFYIFRKYYI